MMNGQQQRVLVVDDDPSLRELLCDYLGSNGFAVRVAADGQALRAALAEETPDVVVMDLMLPGEDGLSLTRFLRSQGDLPILMLSARGEEMDRIIGLEVGADDYLPKPFSPRELLARLRALLRRQSAPAGPVSQTAGVANTLSFGPYRVDVDGRRLLGVDGEIPLTTAEFDLLLAFLQRPNRVLSRDMLVELLRGYDRDPYDRSVDIRVTRLRRKIEPQPAAPVFIRTVRGVGYLFNPLGHET
jgi:two-component system phosphate regulon response regulator OmpR